MSLPQNILVPTDFSPHSSDALNQAVDLATRNNATIHLLHVIDRRRPHQIVAEMAVDQDGLAKKLAARDEKTSKEMLEKQIAGLGHTKGIQITTDVKTGAPSEVILRAEREKSVDLIMMGSNGERGFLKNLLGDVSYQVVKGARCTVTVVRP